MLADETEDCALWVLTIEPARLQVQRICWQASWGQKVKIPGGVVANADTLYADRRCANAGGRGGGQRLCRVLHEVTVRADPTSQE